MSRRLVTVLYEDQHAKGEKNYGPHMLALACVADRVGVSRYVLRDRVVAIALGGDGNVKRRLVEDGADLAATGPLVVMFDNDKVRRCYDLPSHTLKRDVAAKICSATVGSPAVLLLVENMEDLLSACCIALERPRPAGKLRPLERDGIMQAAAAASQGARDKILGAIPSFRCLVDVICQHLGAIDD